MIPRTRQHFIVLLSVFACAASLGAAQAAITLQIAIPGNVFPDGMEGEPYPDFVCEVAAPPAIYLWGTTSQLPSGMEFYANGTLGLFPGLPTLDFGSGGVYAIDVSVQQLFGGVIANGNATITLTIHRRINISSSANLPDGVRNSAYSAFVTTVDGYGDPTFEITDGQLPPGLALDPATGEISGTPTQDGAYAFTIGVFDEWTNPTSDSQSFALDIGNPVQAATASTLPLATIGAPYSATLNASKGTAPYAWVVTGLPAGLAASPSGTISGTPSAGTEGLYTLRCTVTDSAPLYPTSATTLLPLSVYPPGTTPLTIMTTALGSCEENVGYWSQLEAANGTGNHTWDAIGLPPGLSLDNDIISGIPAFGTAGEYWINILVDDGSDTTSVIIPLIVVPTSSTSVGASPGTSDAANHLAATPDLTGAAAGCSLGNGNGEVLWWLTLLMPLLLAGKQRRESILDA